MCSYSKATQEQAKKLRIIDDALFRLIAQRKPVCQEILRTLLDDDKLEVISTTPQERLVSTSREVILDAMCILSDGTYCNIEMQKGKSDADVKRTRFHAAVITSIKTLKGTGFHNIPTVKILYITEYDALGNNQTLTHISRCQNISGKYFPVDDGEDIIFANTEVRDNSDHSELLQLFLRTDSFQNDKYPELSNAIKHYKETKEGAGEMCKIVEDYAKEYAKERVLLLDAQNLVNYVNRAATSFKCPLEEACLAMGVTIEEYNNAQALIASQPTLAQ